MATPQPVQFRWGIISTGKIAERFVKVAAVGSRTVDKAKEFIATVAGGDKTIKAYGSYAEVYADKDVDAVYIGTPHTYHYENALDAIKAKKNVLCEKPVSCNSAELRSLIAAAKENNVFFMEALWTRFHPLALEVKRLIFGLLYKAIIALYEHSANNHVRPAVSGAMLKTPITGVDASTAFVLTSPHLQTAILSCSISLNAPDPGVTIRFEKGTIKIAPPIYCPKQFTVQYFGGNGKLVREETKAGKLESDLWGHEKSLLEMNIFDELRKQGGYEFPPGVEKVSN
ncbi:NAD(P)-binding protein [Salix suchowensis]|nr:NAD(P)-binding protein [Salix suchowensis]